MKKVFIASSNDLADERKELKTLLYDQGFKPIVWENSDHSITQEEYQERLNREYLSGSDIVIFMIKNRYGKYTREEFEFSYSKLEKGIERILVYFFPQDITNISYEDIKNIKDLQKFLEDKEKKIYEKVQNINELKIKILEQKDYWSQPQKDVYSIEKSQEENEFKNAVVEFLISQNDTQLLQKKALSFLPEDYKNPLPHTVADIVQLLIDYGRSDNHCVPLICTLYALYQHYSYEKILNQYIQYLKVKYDTTDSCQCSENSVASDIHIGIELIDSGDENPLPEGYYSIKLWEYFNNSYKSYRLEYTKGVYIKDTESIAEFFNYLDDEFSRYENIYIEIILPLVIYEKEILVADEEQNYGIKKWHIIRGSRNKKIAISSLYQYIYRIQDRFHMPSEVTKRWKQAGIVSSKINLS